MSGRIISSYAAVTFIIIFGTFYGILQVRAVDKGPEARVVEGESLGHDSAHASIVRDLGASGLEALRYEQPSFKDGHTVSREVVLSNDVHEVVIVVRAEGGILELEFKVDGSQRFATYVDSGEYVEYRREIGVAAGSHEIAIRAEGLDSGARLLLDRVEFLSVVGVPVEGENADSCTLYAAESGSDSNTGSESSPFGSVQSLLDSLKPGQTGCLKEGVYTDPDDNIKVNTGGTSDQERVTLKSAPGQRATINARLYVPEGSNYVTVKDLVLDGSRAPKCSSTETCNILPSPTVNGNHVHFLNNEVTNRNKGICFNVGSSAQETARGTLIKNNRIHNCGRLPATNHDHGIYLNFAKATQIFGNTIYDNADRGIQLRANADGTIIKRNVIDGNGQGLVFSGAFGEASDNTTVRYNVITFSTDRYDVEAWYPDGNPQGAGNSVYSNCIYGGNQGEIKSSNGGFTARDNAFEDPLYADRANHNYVVRNNGCPAVWDGIPDAGHR